MAIEFRWAQNDPPRLPELAADLVRGRVAVIAAVGRTAALAGKALTSTIPIVFTSAFDPVEQGLVASLNRPEGDVTPFTFLNGEVERKQLGLIHELLPRATRFAFLLSCGIATRGIAITDLRAAAESIGGEMDVLDAGTRAEIDQAFADLVQKHIEALLVEDVFLFRDRRTQILTLAARHAIPIIYGGRADVEAAS